MIAMNDVLQRDDAEVRTLQRRAARAPLDAARRAAPARLMRPHPAGDRLLGDPHRGMMDIGRTSEAKPQARSSQEGHPNDRKQIAAVIRDYIARERMSREQFAFKTKLGKSTVDKLLTGLFSDKTLSIVESHTKLSLRAMIHRLHAPAVARPYELGDRPALSVLDGPSIAVLPFANMSSDLDQEHVADGLVEDIITALSHVPRLLVIARTSTFAYKGQPADVRRVGRELGVRFVVEGSVRRAGSRLRVTSQLIDAATGAHLWAGRHDGAFEDVFDLQDQVTATVVAAVATRLSGDAVRCPDCA
jgi:adenylate cyclase